MKISAIIISRDEEKNITDCIKAVSFADEIVVIDNGSLDNTRSQAKSLGAKVYKVEGLDFSNLRNIGQQKAKGKWLLYIDADERVSDKLSFEIKQSISKQDNISAFKIRRRNFYFGTPWPFTEEIVRLIRKDALINWQGVVHESPKVRGKIGKLTHPLFHFTHRNLKQMIEKTNEWSQIEAELKYKANHPPVSWWRFFRVMITVFYKYYFSEGGYRVGVVGLIESTYQAFSVFITYAKLWEMQNTNNKK